VYNTEENNSKPFLFLIGVLIILLGGCLICGCSTPPTQTPSSGLQNIGKILKVEEISKDPPQTLVTTEYAYITTPFPTNKIPVGARAKLEVDDYDGVVFLSFGGSMQYMITGIKYKNVK